MRKLFRLLTFIVAASMGLGVLTQPASASFKECVPGVTDTILRNTKSICETSCKKEKDQKGCVAVCDGDYKHCSDKLKDLDHQKFLCRKPYTDCLQKCPSGNGPDNKKCEDACDRSDVFTKYEACIKKLVP